MSTVKRAALLRRGPGHVTCYGEETGCVERVVCSAGEVVRRRCNGRKTGTCPSIGITT